MSKSTNKLQLQQLFSLMEGNPAIAIGFFKGGKEELARFWRTVEADLNSMGPPIKCVTEWKKVWADQKKYVRQKAAQHQQYIKGTGGGPNKELKLSAIEEGIFNLVGMKTAVEGVAIKPCGLVAKKDGRDGVTAVEEVAATVCGLVGSGTEDGLPCAAEGRDDEEESIACADVAQKSVTVTSLKQSKSVKSASDALQAELNIQKEMLTTIKEAVANSEKHFQQTKRLARSLEKANDLRKSHYKQMEKLKREELDEMQRHNAFMEKMRATEIEYQLEKNRIELELLQH